ncbi:hypothetical protein [Endozoicomonas sp. ALB115]|uniref:hypothetical protein n=1 Tax=Endozoicomonas sp. ALB115 TaxID=3403074 RepID=UPI003BB74592
MDRASTATASCAISPIINDGRETVERAIMGLPVAMHGKVAAIASILHHGCGIATDQHRFAIDKAMMVVQLEKQIRYFLENSSSGITVHFRALNNGGLNASDNPPDFISVIIRR